MQTAHRSDHTMRYGRVSQTDWHPRYLQNAILIGEHSSTIPKTVLSLCAKQQGYNRSQTILCSAAIWLSNIHKSVTPYRHYRQNPLVYHFQLIYNKYVWFYFRIFR